MKAVLLDLDDTLYDHTYAQRWAMRRLWQSDARLRRLRLTELIARDQAILTAVHRNLVLPGKLRQDESRVLRVQRLFASIGAPVSESEARKWSALRRSTYLAHQRAVPGAGGVLRTLRAQGITRIVVSNNVTREQTEKLERIGLLDLLDDLVISDAVGAAKPDPRIFQEALRRAGCEPSAAVFVGDSWPDDVEGALASGITPVWFNRGGTPAPRHANVHVLRSWTPMTRALRTLGAVRSRPPKE